jgi:hypothetical protein
LLAESGQFPGVYFIILCYIQWAGTKLI